MESYPVYLGRPWMNHSTNSFSGWTITLTAQSGALLISALALLVRMAGESLWSIVAFTLHQHRTTDVPTTALNRQLQVVLRNPSPSFNSAVEMLKMGWVWHGHIRKPLRSTLALACAPLLIFSSFTVAGIFVARVTTPAYETNQVLLRPTSCGLQNWLPDQIESFISIKAKWANDMRRSRAYASECYGVPDKTVGCTSLPVQQLPYTLTSNASCPFTRGCLGAVSFDTGILDSHRHLGINAESKDRVAFQFTTSCAVIDISDRTIDETDPSGNGGYLMDTVYLGPTLGLNHTFQYSQLQTLQPISYSLTAVRQYGGTQLSTSDWQPIPEFRIGDGDLTVGFIAANNVMYLGKVFDPMFSAFAVGGCQYGDCAYLPDNHFTTVACIDRMRICDLGDLGRCSRLVGSKMIYPGALGLNLNQAATAERVLEARFHSIMWDAIAQQGGKALMANDLVVDLVSTALAPNQWIMETERWFQTLLANIQYRIVDFPNNDWMAQWPLLPAPSDPRAWLNGSSSAMENLCNRQLVRNTAQYQSFSLAGVLIVAVLSVAIIITSWLLESCVFRRKNRQPGRTRRYKRVAYAADGKLQLLRVVFQSAGYHGWQGKLDDIPYRTPLNAFHQNDIEPTGEDEDAAESDSMPLQPMNSNVSYTTQQNYTYVAQPNIVADNAYPQQHPSRRPSPAPEHLYPQQDASAPARRPSPVSFHSSPPTGQDTFSSPPMVNDGFTPLVQYSDRYAQRR